MAEGVQGFKGSRGQGDKGTRGQGFKGTRVQGDKATGRQELCAISLVRMDASHIAGPLDPWTLGPHLLRPRKPQRLIHPIIRLQHRAPLPERLALRLVLRKAE